MGPFVCPKSKLEHTCLPENAKNSRREGGGTHILHSPLCRRPTHWWGRTYEEDGDAVREDEVGGNLAVKLGQR